MRGIRQIGAALAVVLGMLTGALPAVAQEARLKQAAQHFADLEDDQARALLEELSAEGVADADVLLGYLYSDPLLEDRDYEKAVSVFEKAAADGNEEAIFQLAESRFWPEYSEWTLTPEEKAVRPSADDAFGLLQRIVGDKEPPFEGHNAAKWRLAWLCTFGAYDCGKKLTDQAVKAAGLILGDNLRAITAAYGMMDIQRSGNTDTPKNTSMLETYLAVGYAAADPFVAAIASDPAWSKVATLSDCPDPEYIDAAGRLMALANRTAAKSDGSLNFADCYDDAQSEEIEKRLLTMLDYAVRAFGYENSWSPRWCYDNHEWPAVGRCLITTVRDHFFACAKLSMPNYFNERFEIEYRDSQRYERCRAHMLALHWR